LKSGRRRPRRRQERRLAKAAAERLKASRLARRARSESATVRHEVPFPRAARLVY
jgi:hypothetical protein